MKIYSFEKLQVLQQSRILTKETYLIRKSFPDEEKFGLTTQKKHELIRTKTE
jgi:hypothetical protein